MGIHSTPRIARRSCGFLALCVLLLVASSASSGDRLQEGLAHLKLAWTQVEREAWEPAVREAAAATSLLRPNGGKYLIEALEVLGNSEVMLGRPAQAADHFREGLSACTSCEERNRLRLGLSNAYRDLGRFSEAESLLREVLKDAEATGSTADQALSFKGLAGLAAVQGRRAEALPFFQEALRKGGAAEKPAARARLLESIGVLLSEAGDNLQAIDSLRQAEDLVVRLSDPSRLLSIRVNLARAYVDLGRYDTALALFEEVEKTARQRGDQSEFARALTGSAGILQIRGRDEDARKRFEEALPIERKIGRHGGEANILDHLAHLDLIRGRYDLAFSRFEEAIAVSRAAGDRQSELTSLADSADVYLKLNRGDEASARTQRAGELATEIAPQNRSLEALVRIMQLFSAHRPDEALRQTDQALAQARQSGERFAEGKLLVIRAGLLILLGRSEDALQAAEAALAVSREAGDREGEAQLQFLIGFTLLLQQRYDEARAALELSLRFEREIGSSGQRAVTLWALGATYEKQGKSTEACAAFREAAEISESAFTEVRSDDLLAGLAENAAGSYGRLVGLLAQKGDVEQAFAVAEKSRARAFLRRMGNPLPNIHKNVDLALVHEEESLRGKIQDLERQLRQELRKPLAEQDRGALAKVARDIDSSQRAFGNLLIRIQQASPEYASMVHPTPLTLPEVQKLLPAETTLIEYFLVEDATLAWVIDRDSVHLVRLTMQGEDIAKNVNELRQRIAAHEPIAKSAFILYTFLFDQLVRHIHHPNVIVVPHGALHALPFAVLTPDVGKTYLVERYTLSTLPSASVLPFVLAKRSPEGGSMLALGDPDGSLPAAASEARTVAALYGERALLGRAASADALRRAPRPIEHLHIAAHTTFDPVRPLFSRIRLADGDLTVHDIFDLDLRGTHLVVLSGCETGRGDPTRGDELEGLSRAFLYAGAPATITTQWAVDDEASRVLMESFYRNLRKSLRTAEALRQAQIEVLHSKEWSLPFFWAPFTLTGDPGSAAANPAKE